MRSFFLVFISLLLSQPLLGQELNCRISIQAPTAQTIDPQVLQQMQADMGQYINRRQWTETNYQNFERIDCSITIILATVTNGDRFEGTAQVQAQRVAFNTNYQTLTLNFQDPHFVAIYNPTVALEYSETAFQNNLTALLNFYAMMIIAFDRDSYSPGGGTPFFQRAQQVVGLSASSGLPGWRAIDGSRSRYWLAENMLNNSYRNLHTILYQYHRSGLDVMAEDPIAGREAIINAVQSLEQLFRRNPNVYAVRVFLDTKGQELTSIFQNGTPQQKQLFLRAMEVIDPSNLSTYQRVNQVSPTGN